MGFISTRRFWGFRDWHSAYLIAHPLLELQKETIFKSVPIGILIGKPLGSSQ
jgi:hypothetical protein